jgi:hypothetical protein
MFRYSPFISFSYRIIIYHAFFISSGGENLQVSSSQLPGGRSYQSSVAKFSVDSRDREELKEENVEVLEACSVCKNQPTPSSYRGLNMI